MKTCTELGMKFFGLCRKIKRYQKVFKNPKKSLNLWFILLFLCRDLCLDYFIHNFGFYNFFSLYNHLNA